MFESKKSTTNTFPKTEMNITTPKNLNSSNNSVSSSSQIRVSHLKPPHLESKVPSFLQQTRVSLSVPKHDNDLPDYTNSPFPLSEEQRNMRSLTHILGVSSLDGSYHSSAVKGSELLRKETIMINSRGGKKTSITSGQRRNSAEAIDIFQTNQSILREKRYIKLEKFLDNIWFNLWLIFVTLYALFGNDFSVLVTPNSWETFFDTINIVSVVSFLIELVISFIVSKEYRWAFFFWLDLISTLSILFDLSFIPTEAIQTQ